MYRVHVDVDMTNRFQWLLPPQTLSSQLTQETPVTIKVGDTIVLRQSSFKFEKLVPVIPTRFVMLNIPLDCSADVPSLRSGCKKGSSSSSNEEASSVVGPLFQLVVHVIQRIRCVLLQTIAARSSTSTFDASTILELLEIVCDTQRGHTIVTVALPSSLFMVDLLQICDEKIQSDWFSDEHGAPVAAYQASRRVLALPCDGRTVEETGGWFAVEEDHYALPSCTLCCDRLDRSISGITTKVCDCNDTACTCVSASRCPVCVASLQRERPCSQCGSVDDTWVCMLCGFLGCSRYRLMHVQQHCEASSHNFSLSLTTQQVWDYQSDRFVHRMILVNSELTGMSERLEIPDGRESLFDSFTQRSKAVGGGGGGGGSSKVLVDAKLDAKIEQCCTEYTKQLIASLAVQRSYYMSLLKQSEFNSGHVDVGVLRATVGPPVAHQQEHGLGGCGGIGDSTVVLTDAFRSLAMDLNSTLQANKSAVELMRELQRTEQEITTLSQNNAEAETVQQQLKHEYRSLISADTTQVTQLEQQVKELEESVHELKLNVEFRQRLRRADGRGDATTGATMAVLGGGRDPPKRGRK